MTLVCGRKRSFFYEDNETQMNPLFKKLRCSSQVFKTPVTEPKPDQTNQSHEPNLPQTGSEWVKLLVNEMTGAISLEDVKSRAGKVLEILGKEINARARAREETLESVVEEKERVIEVLSTENSVLKKGVAMLHERCKGLEEKEKESKKLVCGYEERIKTLEVRNYALSTHLNQALKGDSFHGFYNHVF